MKDHVLITGASEGIGREFAKIFALNGHPLILVARNKARLTEIADELTARFKVDARTISKDLGEPDAADALKTEVDNQGLRVGILINNAGAGIHGFFHQTDWKSTETMLRLNMLALTHLTRLFLPDMLKKGRGKILNVASTAAFQPGPLMACYFASKAYVLSFTEAIANEVTGTGVTITAFCPGPTRTEFQKRSGTENIRENSFAMDAQEAVRIAYQEMMRGKTLVVPGVFNKLLAILVRLVPRKLVTRITRFLEEKK